ncbi:MAG: hypothetical protein D6811_02405 [Alphaproteobacteria bacterium]|nr:MAG: hypothetical protein D6811_02405 [Alphaproteobacteria bacterium]
MDREFDAVILHLCETLLTTFSVTAALQVWCEVRDLGTGMLRSEVRPQSGQLALPALGQELLKPKPEETVRHRAITLMRGELPLLDADNWYIPERLPLRARLLLETTDTPFGTALEGTLQNRETFSALLPPHIMARFNGRDRIRQTLMSGDPEVPVLTVRGVVTVDTVPVSFVEERLRPELVRASARSGL